MKTIAILNSKGGVGKTTLAVTLAAGLAATGKKVVLVDTDPQGNVAKWFGMPEESGIYDLLIKERPIEGLLRLVPPEQWWTGETSGVLAILPGNELTTAAGITLAITKTAASKLKRLLEPLSGAIDFVVLDTAPTVTELMANVFVATDYVIVPTETQFLSVNGVHKTFDRVCVAHEEHLTLPVLGIQPTRHAARQIEGRENLKVLTDTYGDLVWEPISARTVWATAPSYARSIFAVPRNRAAVQDAARFIQAFATAMQKEGVAL